jgi:anti-sigma regulatory factor (Ser/Thr protein kinase)
VEISRPEPVSGAMTLHRISFPGSIVHCGALRRCIKAFGITEGYSSSFLSELELTLHEAFVNAVRHGNLSNPELPVSLILCDGREAGVRYLRVEVRDCGNGYSLPERHDFSRSGDARVLSGRGLPLIVHFADSVRNETRPEGSVLILHYIPY